MNPYNQTLTVESLAYGGDGVAHIEGRVIFIPETLPGDIVRVRVAQDKGTYLRGALEEILEPSPDRVPFMCSMADKCGGCQWLGLAYPVQLTWKRAIVEESLRRIGHIEDVAVEPCLPSPLERGYRTVVRFPARNTAAGLAMGYFERRTHHAVDVGDCPLTGERANRIARYIRTMTDLKSLDIREVTIRAGHNHSSSLVSFLLGRNGRFEEIANRMLAEIEGLEGVSFWREDTAGKSAVCASMAPPTGTRPCGGKHSASRSAPSFRSTSPRRKTWCNSSRR